MFLVWFFFFVCVASGFSQPYTANIVFLLMVGPRAALRRQRGCRGRAAGTASPISIVPRGCPHPACHQGPVQRVTGGNTKICLTGWFFPRPSPERQGCVHCTGLAPWQRILQLMLQCISWDISLKALNLSKQKLHHLISHSKQIPGCPGAWQGISHLAPAALGFSLLSGSVTLKCMSAA